MICYASSSRPSQTELRWKMRYTNADRLVRPHAQSQSVDMIYSGPIPRRRKQAVRFRSSSSWDTCAGGQFSNNTQRRACCRSGSAGQPGADENGRRRWCTIQPWSRDSGHLPPSAGWFHAIEPSSTLLLCYSGGSLLKQAAEAQMSAFTVRALPASTGSVPGVAKLRDGQPTDVNPCFRGGMNLQTFSSWSNRTLRYDASGDKNLRGGTSVR